MIYYAYVSVCLGRMLCLWSGQSAAEHPTTDCVITTTIKHVISFPNGGVHIVEINCSVISTSSSSNRLFICLIHLYFRGKWNTCKIKYVTYAYAVRETTFAFTIIGLDFRHESPLTDCAFKTQTFKKCRFFPTSLASRL